MYVDVEDRTPAAQSRPVRVGVAPSPFAKHMGDRLSNPGSSIGRTS